MEQIYNYIIDNKINGSITLPFKYRIREDTVYIDLWAYTTYLETLRSCLKVDSIIHDVTGCPKLYINNTMYHTTYIWNGHRYTD